MTGSAQVSRRDAGGQFSYAPTLLQTTSEPSVVSTRLLPGAASRGHTGKPPFDGVGPAKSQKLRFQAATAPASRGGMPL